MKTNEDIKNLKKAADRILRAIKRKEKIILYGDADLDGATSVIILKETIQNLGGSVSAVYFPDREKEGYGINEKALCYLKKISPALLIVLDCGISNFKEVKLAKELGFEVIIIDHHQVLDKLPKPAIIVDPKQKGDNYSFKKLANVGIVFKLSQKMLGNNLSSSLRNNFLELVALGTVADMMPLKEENKIFLIEGMDSLKKTFRPGLKVFQKLKVFKEIKSAEEFLQKIVSVLNISDVKEHLTETYIILTSKNIKTAEVIAKKLLKKSLERKYKIEDITGEIEKIVSKKPEEIIIFEGSGKWPLVVLGAVASRICYKYRKPVFIFKKGKEKSRGAVRTPSGIDGVEAMKKCSKFLDTFGGHALAAGFYIKNENLEAFKDCLIKHFRNF